MSDTKETNEPARGPDLRDRIAILVVDDERLIRLTICARLKAAGYYTVAAGSVDEAVTAMKEARGSFGAIISDIMMGDMDGFVFRDIVRGVDPAIPIFFLTALDPEEGSGFLRRIMEDPISYYLPKSVDTRVLIQRVRRVIASRRVELFIEKKMRDDAKSLELAANIQKSMLPVRSMMTPRGFYTTWWRPMDVVSGDLYEAVPFGTGCYLYVLGDIQGHGTSAALAMTAVQSFLKHLVHREGNPLMSPAEVANLLQNFFRTNLADVSYMTALICVHRPLHGEVSWISCGAPDLVVVDKGKTLDINPGHRGGLPIGLVPDTIYSDRDVVTTPLERSAVCICFTDGLFELARDEDGSDKLPSDLSNRIGEELTAAMREDGSMMVGPHRFIHACAENGYSKVGDDTTILLFGAHVMLDGIYEATVPLTPDDVDSASQSLAEWCRQEGWDAGDISRVQLVLEEKLMNVHDHGFNDRDRLHAVVNLRLRRSGGAPELTVWDGGTQEPSMRVTEGDTSTTFDKANIEMSNHGRGRMMVRELCFGIERLVYAGMNETIYHIKTGDMSGEGGMPK